MNTDPITPSRRAAGASLIQATRGFWLALLGLACFYPASAETDWQEWRGRAPNVVFIFTDDLGYGDIGIYGADDIATPRIDSLATEGLLFTDFYAASPVCSPSRASLLTGRYAVRMGINGVFFPESFTGLDPEVTTVGELLQDAGYRTALVGKWHLGHHHRYLPLQNGFDEYFGIPYSNDMEMLIYLRGNEVESFSVDQTQMTRRLTEEAVAFMERASAREEPFFLLLSHPMPHVPLYVSEPFEGASERGLYGDVIQELDWSVGQVLDAAQRLGIDEETLVVFTSDNGPWLSMKEHGGSPGITRSGKFYTYEGGMRVPTVACWPGVIPAGSVSQEAASMLDWLPTLSFLAGVEPPPEVELDGELIVARLAGEDRPQERGFLYFRPDGELGAYREGPWKLKLPMPERPDAWWRHGEAARPLSLYDLRDDPGETRNLVAARPEVVRRLQGAIAERMEALGDLPPSKVMKTPADESHLEYLRSLD